MSDTASREWRFYIDDMICQPALDNPDLPIDFVRELLIARTEDPALATPFVTEGKRD
jgi:hypothetical protein